MTLPNVKYDVRNVRHNARIVRAARVGRELAEGYPRAAAGVVHVLSVAFAVLFRSDYTTLAAALGLAAFLAFIGWDRWRNREEPEPEHHGPSEAELWFLGVCRYACVPEPLVLADWPTEDGHAFRLLVTYNSEPDEYGVKRPITVKRFETFGGLLKDCAGLGCTTVNIEPDPANGGRCTAYVNGVRFEPWTPPEPEPERDPTTLLSIPAVARLSCSAKGCDTMPAVHVVTEAMPNLWVCAEHADAAIEHLGHVTDCHDFTEACTWQACGDEPDADEDDRECTPDSEPLSPLHLPEMGAREGSGALPPPDLTTRRPPGADPGSRGGVLWDTLTAAEGPLRRGTMAEAAGLSPGYVDKLLTAWADLGMVQRVGSLWIASTGYTASGNLPAHGDEEDQRGSAA